MQIWTDLIIRQLFFVGLVGALGLAPALLLSSRFDTGARLALAPVLGLCIGACVSVTLAYWFAADQTSWVLVVLALASLLGAAWLCRGRLRRPHLHGALQVTLIAVVVLGAFDYPLVTRGTVGPVGGYQISDMSGYVSEADSARHVSIRDAEHQDAPYRNLAEGFWDTYVKANQQVDLGPLDGTLDDLLGLGATETQTAFLIAVLLVGALGAYGTVRSAARRPTWAATLAGCLFAGALFVELVMDGSQAAISGAVVLAPLIAVGADVLRTPRWRSLLALAILAAGLQTLYPLFVPAVVIGAGLSLAVLLVYRQLRGPRLTAGAIRPLTLAGAQLISVIALAMAFTPVAAARNVRYWVSILNGSFSLSGLPSYAMPSGALPGWLLQTRSFYSLVPLGRTGTSELLLSAAVPALIILVIAVGLVRDRTALLILAVCAGAAILAYYTRVSQDCTYCEQRNLLPVGALAPTGLALGVAALVGWRGGFGRAAAAVVTIIVLLAVGHEAVIQRQRLVHGTYLLDGQNRRVLAVLPRHSGPLLLEGFSEGSQAPMELPQIYNLAQEVTSGNVSLPTFAADNSGLFDFGGPSPLGPSFVSNYQYVLTRLGSVRTGRRTVAGDGAIELQRRASPLDVTAVAGLSVAPVDLDHQGLAWVVPNEAAQFLVAGAPAGRPAWIQLGLRASVPVRVLRNPDLVSHRRSGDELQICLRAPGAGPVRVATVQTSFAATRPPSGNQYDNPLPAHGLRLASMSISERPCSSR